MSIAPVRTAFGRERRAPLGPGGFAPPVGPSWRRSRRRRTSPAWHDCSHGLPGPDRPCAGGRLAHEAYPKIEVYRPSHGAPPKCWPDDPDVVALAADAPVAAHSSVPQLNLNHPPDVAAFILALPELHRPPHVAPRPHRGRLWQTGGHRTDSGSTIPVRRRALRWRAGLARGSPRNRLLASLAPRLAPAARPRQVRSQPSPCRPPLPAAVSHPALSSRRFCATRGRGGERCHDSFWPRCVCP